MRQFNYKSSPACSLPFFPSLDKSFLKKKNIYIKAEEIKSF